MYVLYIVYMWRIPLKILREVTVRIKNQYCCILTYFNALWVVTLWLCERKKENEMDGYREGIRTK